jgi:cytochrome c
MHFSFLEKLGLGVLAAAWLVWGSGQIGSMLVHADEGNIDDLRIAVAESEAPADEVAAVEESALVLLASLDASAGEKTFKKCAACHSAEQGGGHKVGPNLYGVVGRAKDAADGFAYSGALAEAGPEWSYEALDAFLTDPAAYAPGNKMSFRGLKKAKDRAAVIAYLRGQHDSPPPLP